MAFILIVGAGRVGSAIARQTLAADNEVSILDEDPLSHERLDSGMDTTWEDAGGRFTVGHGMEVDALREAGIEEADVFIASTDGDNTNLTIAQIAAKQFEVPRSSCASWTRPAPSGTPSRACTRSARRSTRSRCSSEALGREAI